MADKDDKDTSFGGSQGGYGSSPGSSGGYQSGYSDTPSSGRSNSGLGSSTNSGGGSNTSSGGGSNTNSGGSYAGQDSGGSYGGSPGGNTNSGGGSNVPGNSYANDAGNTNSGGGNVSSGSPNGGGSGNNNRGVSIGNNGKGYGFGSPNTTASVPGNTFANDAGNVTPTGGVNSQTPTGITPTGTTPTGTTPGNTYANETATPTITSRVDNAPPSGYDPNAVGETVRASLNPSTFAYDVVSGMVGAAVASPTATAPTPTGMNPGMLGGVPMSTPTSFAPTGLGTAAFDLSGRNRMTPAMGTIAGATPSEAVVPDAPGMSMAGTETAIAAGPMTARQTEIQSMRAYADLPQTSPAQARVAEEQGMVDLDDALMDAVVDRMIGVESGYDPTAQNPNSTATGLGQFTKDTWLGLIEDVRPETVGMTDAQKLEMRNNPTISRQMTKALAQQNADYLTNNGIEVTAESIYGAHFLGAAGYKNAVNANPAASAVSVLGQQVVDANPGIMRGQTIGHVVDYINEHMAGTLEGVEGAQRMGAAPDIDIPGSNATPSISGPAAVAGTGPGTQGFPATPTPGGVQDEAGGVPTPTPAPRGTPAAAGGTVTTAVPGTAGFPATPPPNAQAPGFPSFKTPATGYKRSGLGTVLGVGIDAIASIAGGPVSLAANGAAYMLTGDTIGGMTADMIGGKYGPNQYQPGADDRYSGDRAGGAGSGGQTTRGVNNPVTTSQPTTPPVDTDSTDPDTVANDFVTTYIDPVKRPTPFEKWGRSFGWTSDATL